MHPLETGMGVPAFLAKLWRLVEDQETNNLISWSNDGRSFIIQNQAKFAKELLPLNYKHNNMASFIRQLNMYGFHKITSIDNGGLKFDRDEMEFSHPYFQKGHPYLLEHIKRKIANAKQETEKAGAKPDTMTRVLSEVKNMNRRQESLDSRFSAMKQENEALWREVAILRQKHMKQQQIVNKLIQFLVTIVQPQRSGLGGSGIGKRRGQLMINDVPQTKLRKNNAGPIIRELTEELLDDLDSDIEDVLINNEITTRSPDSASSKDFEASNSSEIGRSRSVASDVTGGVEEIDEIDTNNMAIYSGTKKDLVDKLSSASGSGSSNDLSMTVGQNEQPSLSSTSPGKSLLIPIKGSDGDQLDVDLMLNVLNDPIIEDVEAAGTSSNQLNEPSQVTDEQFNGDLFDKANKEAMRITKYNPSSNNDILRLNSVDDYSSHLNNVQTDLDGLKDLLRNENYCFDPNTLMNSEDLQMQMNSNQYDVDTINKLFDGDSLVGYEMSPSNMDLFSDDKKDGDAQQDIVSYQPTYNNNLDINELLQDVSDSVVAEAE